MNVSDSVPVPVPCSASANANASCAGAWNDTELFPFPPLSELVPISLFYATVFLTGLAGNLAVLLVICAAREDSPLDNSILSLTLADLSVIIFCLPIRCARWFSYTWIYGAFLCKAVHYVQATSMAASAYTATTIALARYQATFHSLEIRSSQSRRRMRLTLLACWIFAVLLASPVLHVQNLYQIFEWSEHYWCVKSFPLIGLDGAAVAYEMYFFVALFVVPVCCIGFAYFRITTLLRERSFRVVRTADCSTQLTSAKCTSQMANQTSRKSTGHRKLLVHISGLHSEKIKNKNIIRLLLATVVAFIFCHAPIQIDNLLQAFGVLSRFNPQPLKVIRMLTSLLSSVNSSVNPFIYCFVSVKFRRRMHYGVRNLFRNTGTRRCAHILCSRILRALSSPATIPSSWNQGAAKNSKQTESDRAPHGANFELKDTPL